MAKSLSKIHLIDQMKSTGVLPVFQHTHSQVLFQVMRIIYRGGITILEFKHLRDSRSFKAFRQMAELASEFPELTLGVGTVLDAEAAHQYIKAGAQFISSPFLHKDMGSICEDYNVVWMPGCSTLEEVTQAVNQRADIINVMQGSMPVMDFLRQCSRDFPEMYFVPSAGIELHRHQLTSLFEAGALCLRLGDSLFKRNDILTKDWTRMEINFYQTVKNISQLKKSVKISYDYSISA
jgi:2-dehydro-3-deoxyphosphogluconate aldolase / (4S)-4-hydroxy-2-oxoglutarate aldolase